jgi:deazaflavin-dependent oxidoreductase (nitroreductase family)
LVRRYRCARAHDRDRIRREAANVTRALIDRLQKSVINPLDKLAFALRTPPPGDALLETTGRRTGQPRVTPICDCLEGDTFWIVAQRGRGSDCVRNIEANPRVRVKDSLSDSHWRAGTAHILDDDDPRSACESSVAATAGADGAWRPRLQ